MSKKLFLPLALGIGAVAFASQALAYVPSNSSGGHENTSIYAAPEVGYYDMTPDFTTNLASSGNSKLHYLRIHVNIMLKDSRDIPLVTQHDPLVRDAILGIIGSKEYGTVATAAGRETLRAECRARVAELLASKKNAPVVQDLLFTNYVYQ